LVTARQGFIVNKLLRKGGVINKVAAHYVKAGFSVRIKPDQSSRIDFTAVKRSEKYCIKVLWEDKLDEENLARFIEACRDIKYTPVLILYGSAPKISQEILSKYINEVKIRRIRPKA